MVQVINRGIYLFKGREILEDVPENQGLLQRRSALQDEGRRGTMAYGVLQAHNKSGDEHNLELRFDALASHDITFVNIIQTARTSGLEQFPLPYVLTNCHNSLCAVGGTINEDDHMFGLSAAKKYGGIYVPPHLAVIHSYIRETQGGCGRMVLGSDSHTRYGALGTMGVGEGGGELVKQLLGRTYTMAYPPIIGVCLSGRPRSGVGPQDVALALIRAVFKTGFAKNKVLEFFGEGIGSLSADFRFGIDVMTTETTCWSSLWETDDCIRDYLAQHHRSGEYAKMTPADTAYYDGLIRIDLSAIKPMIALPFHPSNAIEIDALLENPGDILRRVEEDGAELLENREVPLKLTDKVDKKGRIWIDQGVIAGCAGGTYENLMAVAAILRGSGPGNPGFALSLYPGSQPVMLELAKNGALGDIISAGGVIRTAFCGPCFGAGDVPAHGGLSIRHTTRNFPNREGSRPMDGQTASVALMDARSIAATARNGGYLCSAATLDFEEQFPPYHYDDSPYKNRVYNGVGNPRGDTALHYGPNITDWPPMEALGENLLLKIAAYITDPVTTTDEIIPSGETSSFRSNPVGLAEFTLSRKDPGYVGRAKEIRRAEAQRLSAVRRETPSAGEGGPVWEEIAGILEQFRAIEGMDARGYAHIQIGSAIFARKPGDGSAREQAASCQRVLGGVANFAGEYATKRYRSNLINWGIIPFTLEGDPPFNLGDYVFIPRIRERIAEGGSSFTAYAAASGKILPFSLTIPELTSPEAEIIREGSLINYNRKRTPGASITAHF
ncbi:MAG: hydratase [Spirochaetaceae bacterium]|jgi:aconitate hydratase|nr:hydratase [Spirochaetaceae bacterium]